MAFEEIVVNNNRSSSFPPDSVTLRIAGYKDGKRLKKDGTPSLNTIFQLQIGSGVLNEMGLNRGDVKTQRFVALARGTGSDAGKVRLMPASNGRAVKRGRSNTTPGSIMLPKALSSELAAYTPGVRECNARVLPDGALEVILPRR